MNALEGSDESPFTPWLGDSRMQSGITRFQSQGLRHGNLGEGLLESEAGRTPQKANTASCAAARFYVENNSTPLGVA